MKWLRRLFLLLVTEIVLTAILGFLTLDNNVYCDNYLGWQWSFTVRPATGASPSCPMLTTSYQSTKLRFIALEGVLATIPITALIGIGYIISLNYQDKPAPKKLATHMTHSEHSLDQLRPGN